MTNEITVQKRNLLCNTDSCNTCINHKFATNEDNGSLIDLRNSKKYTAKINDKNTTKNMILLIGI